MNRNRNPGKSRREILASRRARVARQTPALFEPLEARLLLSLVGVAPDLGYPRISFESTGQTAYNSGTLQFDVTATPLLFKSSSLTPSIGVLAPSDFEIHIKVNHDGTLNGGTPGPDLKLSGLIDTDGDTDTTDDDVFGTLTGEIYRFGYLSTHATGSGTDAYDFVFTATGGTLLGSYAGKQIGVTVSSENSDFQGTFNAPISGDAKGALGPVQFFIFQPVTIGDFVWNDLNANGVQDDGDTGINGVVVDLLDGQGQLITTTTTINNPVGGAPGYYQFWNLTPGTYQVKVDAINPALAGFTASLTGQGEDAALDSNPQPAGTTPSPLLSPGSDQTLDFGYSRTGGNGPVIDIEKYVKDAQDQNGCQGLTPGFWKQCQHFQYWVGYSQSDSYNAVFGVNDPGNPTLLGALQRGGGGSAALGRQAVAALLNAGNGNIAFAFNRADVIAMVRYAYATGNYENVKGVLEEQNTKENVGLPGGPGTWSVGFGSDADTPPGLTTDAGDLVLFTYVVTNPGPAALSDVTVWDDNETPGNGSDDFQPTPIMDDQGFNVGDLSQDNVLQSGEQWLYVWVKPATAGQHQNIATVTGAFGGIIATDQDAANWLATAPGGCGGCGGGDGHHWGGCGGGDGYHWGGWGGGNGCHWGDWNRHGCGSGWFKGSALTGFVYSDKDNDAKKERGEKGIAKVQIRLTGIDDLGRSVSLTTRTDSDGSYSFANLRAGTYTITEVQPSGWRDGKESVGSLGGTVGSDAISGIQLVSGVTGVNYNFGERSKC